MNLISPEQRAKVRLRFEIAFSTIAATVLLSTVILIATPGYITTVQHIVAV